MDMHYVPKIGMYEGLMLAVYMSLSYSSEM